VENSILDLCNNLNETIHEPLYHNFYNIPNELNYNQTFTSIDLIEDSQIAIDEFDNAESIGTDGRSTLLIYGLLQSFFLQQDGLYHLYKCVTDNKIKQLYFFDLFSFDKEIREVRNDIAGHPTNRKNTEFYFIAKGSTTKDRFTYAGYTPEFRKVEVDLKSFIFKQNNFVKNVLIFVQNEVDKKIEMKKNDHKDLKISDMILGVNRNIELIYRGIRDSTRNFQGELGVSGIIGTIKKIKTELNLRYNNNLPGGILEAFRLIEYILKRFDHLQKGNQLYGNDDAEIFLDSLNKQLSELGTMLKEIDKQFT
jgi:hypothetical protein